MFTGAREMAQNLRTFATLLEDSSSYETDQNPVLPIAPEEAQILCGHPHTYAHTHRQRHRYKQIDTQTHTHLNI